MQNTYSIICNAPISLMLHFVVNNFVLPCFNIVDLNLHFAVMLRASSKSSSDCKVFSMKIIVPINSECIAHVNCLGGSIFQIHNHVRFSVIAATRFVSIFSFSCGQYEYAFIFLLANRQHGTVFVRRIRIFHH
jgi:hypothetical protein